MKQLDKVQTGCLRNLVTLSQGGVWRVGCGWEWQSPGKTEKVLDGLATRGLVKKIGQHLGYNVYEVTPVGLKAHQKQREFA